MCGGSGILVYLPEISELFGQRLPGVHRCHVGQGKVQELGEMGEGCPLEEKPNNIEIKKRKNTERFLCSTCSSMFKC